MEKIKFCSNQKNEELFIPFEDKYLFSEHQSGFRTEDLCIYQLFAITHDIFSNLNCNLNLEIRGVILGITKTFDSV